MQYETINIDALKAAMNLMFGVEATEAVQKTYTAFTSAMEKAHSTGYAKGHKDGYEDATSDHEVIAMGNASNLNAIEQRAYDAEREFYNGVDAQSEFEFCDGSGCKDCAA